MRHKSKLEILLRNQFFNVFQTVIELTISGHLFSYIWVVSMRLSYPGNWSIEDDVEVLALLHRRQIRLGRAVSDSPLGRHLHSTESCPMEAISTHEFALLRETRRAGNSLRLYLSSLHSYDLDRSLIYSKRRQQH